MPTIGIRRVGTAHRSARNDDNEALTHYLGQFLTPQRKAKIETVLAHRTRYLTVVLEDIHTSQNAGAVLRNCDNFGIQNVHIIEQTSSFKVNLNVTRGCQKWLTTHRYRQQQRNTQDCIEGLKAKGYRIVATTPHTDACALPDLPLDRPIALLFGNELDGLSETALTCADTHLKIPMYGFSESFNISVSTALCLQSICDRLRQSPYLWQLTSEEQQTLRLQWYRRSCKNLQQLEASFWKTAGTSKCELK